MMNLDEFEAQLDALDKEVTHAEDMVEINKVINTYYQYFQGADCNGITKNIQWDADRVWSDCGMACRMVGSRANLEFFDQRPAVARLRGSLVQHESTSKVVEIAKDGMTAKSTSYSPGYKCLAQGHSQVWSMAKTGHDLIKMDGVWKIWHWHWVVVTEMEAAYGILYQNRSYWKECMFDELEGIHNGNITVPPEPAAPTENYRRNGSMYMFPEPPEPYDTYTESTTLNYTRKY